MNHHESEGDGTGPEVIAQFENRLRTAFQAKASEISVPLPPLELRPGRSAVRTLAARLMGVSPSTVRSAAHRALNSLARSLKEL